MAVSAFQGVVGAIVVLALGLVVIGILESYGGEIVQDTRDDFTNTTPAYRIANNSLTGLEDMSEKNDTLGTVGMAIAVIMLLMAGFGGFLYSRYR